MSIMAELTSLLAEAAAAIETATWTTAEHGAEGAQIFRGESGDWRFTVASYDLTALGFEAGGRGFDGASVKSTTFMRLTPELAERAVRLAEASLIKEKATS